MMYILVQYRQSRTVPQISYINIIESKVVSGGWRMVVSKHLHHYPIHLSNTNESTLILYMMFTYMYSKPRKSKQLHGQLNLGGGWGRGGF